MTTAPKATSVDAQGNEDGFEIRAGFWGEMATGGVTRLVVSVPTAQLAAVHAALVAVLDPPLGYLYRQAVDRRNPKPEGTPSSDFVGLQLERDQVLAVLEQCAGLVYHDARAEHWIRGRRGDQVILDADGLLFCYPDDPGFRDALVKAGLEEEEVASIAGRDYVKHWFHAENDASEDALIAALGLSVMR